MSQPALMFLYFYMEMRDCAWIANMFYFLLKLVEVYPLPRLPVWEFGSNWAQACVGV